jgi:hypothetical protein
LCSNKELTLTCCREGAVGTLAINFMGHLIQGGGFSRRKVNSKFVQQIDEFIECTCFTKTLSSRVLSRSRTTFTTQNLQ